MSDLDESQRIELARECCLATGLDPFRDAQDVIDIADQDTEQWQECCDGGCEPCVAVLQSAALALRRRTGK